MCVILRSMEKPFLCVAASVCLAFKVSLQWTAFHFFFFLIQNFRNRMENQNGADAPGVSWETRKERWREIDGSRFVATILHRSTLLYVSQSYTQVISSQ